MLSCLLTWSCSPYHLVWYWVLGVNFSALPTCYTRMALLIYIIFIKLLFLISWPQHHDLSPWLELPYNYLYLPGCVHPASFTWPGPHGISIKHYQPCFNLLCYLRLLTYHPGQSFLTCFPFPLWYPFPIDFTDPVIPLSTFCTDQVTTPWSYVPFYLTIHNWRYSPGHVIWWENLGFHLLTISTSHKHIV
jgi:hypothetical protein